MKTVLKQMVFGSALVCMITSAIACSPKAFDHSDQERSEQKINNQSVQDRSTTEQAGHQYRRMGERFTQFYTNGKGMFGGIWLNENGEKAPDNNPYRPNRDDVNRYRYDLDDGERFEMDARANLNKGSVREHQPQGGFLRGGKGPRMQTAQKNTQIGHEAQTGYNKEKVERIRNRVLGITGVQDASVIVHHNLILIGIQGDGRRNAMIRQIRQDLQAEARGEHIYVTTDKGLHQAIRNIDQRLGKGEAPSVVADDIGRLLNNFGLNLTTPMNNKPIRVTDRDSLPGGR